MKIGVGSKNKTKVAAVRDAVVLYPELFPDAEVIGVDVVIEEFGHPKGIEEITNGAIERAQKAFDGHSFSFGLESGLIEVPQSFTGFLELQMCAVYDGTHVYLGAAPAFEWPPKVTEFIVGGKDGSQAFREAGYTESEKQGQETGGIIGILTKGRMTREEQARHSVVMALIQLENAEMYKKTL